MNRFDEGRAFLMQNVARLTRPAKDHPVILVIGDRAAVGRTGADMPAAHGMRFLVITDLDADILARIAPDIVISALFCQEFDAVDLARMLQALGFSGRYRALARSMPDPAVVRAEIRAAAPAVDFDLLVLDGLGLRRP